jgi:hypothetical protein
MLKLYARLAGKSIRLALRGWPAAVVLPLYATLLQIATAYAANLGRGAGFVVGLVVAFLGSSYLHLVGMAVGGRKIGFSDFRESFTVHFWDVATVMFAIWVIQLLVGGLTHDAGDRGTIVFILVNLTMVVFFNPVPEMIYLGQGQTGSFGFGRLMEAGRFISAHWPEWLAPSALMAAVLLAPTGLLLHGPLAMQLLVFQSLFSPSGLAAIVSRIPLWLAPFMLIFINCGMVFRGLLLIELGSGGRRPRPWP